MKIANVFVFVIWTLVVGVVSSECLAADERDVGSAVVAGDLSSNVIQVAPVQLIVTDHNRQKMKELISDIIDSPEKYGSEILIKFKDSIGDIDAQRKKRIFGKDGKVINRIPIPEGRDDSIDPYSDD